MPLLGAHMSIAGGLHKAVYRAGEAGCQVLQIFTRSTSQWQAKPLTVRQIDLFLAAAQAVEIAPVAAHTNYLINFASHRPEVRRRSLDALLDEMDRAECLGIPFLILHPGAHGGDGEKIALHRIAGSLSCALQKSPGMQVKVLLETTAGEGNQVGYRFEHLAQIIGQVEDPGRLGICLDTCHLFAAGYDFRTEKGYGALMEAFERTLGLARLCMCHLNDSRRDLGSRIDRHTHIGEGFIGEAAFGFFLNDPRLAGLPFVLETPKGPGPESLDWDRKNLGRLMRLCEKGLQT